MRDGPAHELLVVFHPEWPEGHKVALYRPGTRLGGPEGKLHVRDMAQFLDLMAYINKGEPELLAWANVRRDLGRDAPRFSGEEDT